jgi:hypothetical protein
VRSWHHQKHQTLSPGELLVKEVVRVVQCIKNGREMPKITVFDAVRKLAEVWETQVKETTIFSCFKKAERSRRT